MTTNILATVIVTLVTNVTTVDNAVRGPTLWQDVPANWMAPSEHNIIQATEKYETTSILENRTIQFEAEGKSFTNLLSMREVSSFTRKFVLKSEWQSMGQLTNYPVFGANRGVLTNLYLRTDLVMTNLVVTNLPGLIHPSKP